MGFDNECIPNIQSLAGEYFCPICRQLVYPNEALQSQCTHLYCKACLKYVVSTTRACPYDGYLVTEADSKPLLESNKSLAETIGKIQVLCLYNRSGCTWQGSLSECTTHCSGCAFGNSAVVCDRCGVQLAHRQIQEHGQTCAGVQLQTLSADGSQVAAMAVQPNDNSQVSVQAAITSTISQASQSKTSSTSAQEMTIQSNMSLSTPAAGQASMPTSEQWFQQQQHYQQYYQQYPGYDPYQQYNPYQQQAAQLYQQPHVYAQPSNSLTMVPPQLPIQHPPAQAQAQAQLQPQSQPQSQPLMQLPVAAQPQNLAQMELQQQTQSQFQAQLHPTPHVHLHPQPQLQPHAQAQTVQPQPLVQMPPHQQPPSRSQNAESQIQLLAHSQLQHVPQIQSTSQSQAQMHGHHHQPPIQQHFSSQPSQSGNPSLQTVTSHQSYLQPKSHQPMQLAAPQHPAHMYTQAVPQQHSQHTAQTPSQFHQNPLLIRPLQSHGMPPNLQLTGSLPSSSQVSNTLPGQPNPLLAQAHQTGLPIHQRPVAPPVQQPFYEQFVQNQQQFSGQPLGQNHLSQQIANTQQQMYSQSRLNPQAVPQQIPRPQTHQNTASPYGLQKQQVQNHTGKPVVPPHGVSDKAHLEQSGASLRPMLNGLADSVADKSVKVDASSQDNANTDSGTVSIPAATAGITIKSESNLKSEGDDDKSIGETKDALGLHAANNPDVSVRRVKEEPAEGDGSKKDVPDADNKQEERSISLENKMPKTASLKEGLSHEKSPLKSHDGNLLSQSSSAFPNDQVTFHNQHGPSALLHKHTGPPLFHGTPGELHPAPLGHPTQLRPPGPGQISGFHGPRSASAFPGGQDYYGRPQAPNSQGHGGPPRLNIGMYSNAAGMEGFPGPGFGPSSIVGLRNEKLGPTADDHFHPFSQDPARRGVDRGQLEDLRHFSRPSRFEAEGVLEFGGHFSRTVDRGLHSFRGDIAPRPLENGSYRTTYDAGLKMDSVGAHGPSRHFPPFNHDIILHPSDVGEGPIGFPGKPFCRQDPARTDQNLLGPDIGYHLRHVQGLDSRSPGRDHLSSRGFGPLHGLDDIGGRESRIFDGSSGRSFQGNRFPVLPAHSRRDEFDGPGGLRVSDHYRFSEFIGQDCMANHLRGENFGAHKLPPHLRFSEQAGFGPIPNQPVRESHTPGNFRHALFGEPGFRSSFPHKVFPCGDANYTGELDSFDNLRKRKPSSMGWCRICKVDCETVEGLDLHSQTRGHQTMALDMVATIKQNAKKQKLVPSNNSSLDDISKSRNIVSDGPGDKL
ncbi:unnamed protein product [Linum tenue]|uniref:RING-type domain-containing protein n=1 Tax=Linum tenue TaxID=586396 RepID=A0AAV0Q5U8_9ROSI|nr:unnamed protein product [Linum tenue]